MNSSTLFLITSLILTCKAYGAQQYSLSPETRIQAHISKTHINRIQVEGDRIAAVYGNSDHLEVLADDVGGQLFVKYLAPSSESEFLTLVTEGDIIQDMELVPQPGSAQTIIFKPAKLKKITAPTSQGTHVKKMLALIQQMAREQLTSPKSIIPHDLDKDDRQSPVFELKGYAHSEGEFIAKVFAVKNLTKKPLPINHTLVQSFQKNLHKLLAFAAEREVIQPNETTYCFVVLSQPLKGPVSSGDRP